MQLFALDSQGQPVYARQADKQQDYRCLECGAVVRRRAGPHRQAHYFHLRDATSCFLSGKGMAHLQIQHHLWQLLPKGECMLEHRFAEIGRIADVVWLTKGLIFEVQCSSISAEEVNARNRDYASIGFQVVWILHDTLYNKRRVSDAELTLSEAMHYFSNMDAEGRGEIYDQFDVKKQGRRTVKLSRLTVDLSQPYARESLTPLRSLWPLYFAGDLLDLYAKGSSPYLDKVLAIQKNRGPLILLWMMRPYRMLFQMLLERACR